MKRIFIIGTILAASCLYSTAQISPESYSMEHSDSCWHFTFDYDTPKPKSREGMVVVTHLCTPDTCVSSATRHIYGKRYSKRYLKRYGSRPELTAHGRQSYTLTVPENAVRDTVYGITYYEISDRNGTEYGCDTIVVSLPEAPPMSCHRVDRAQSIADHIALEHPYIKNIRYYNPITDENASGAEITPSIVRYVTNSSKLNPEYLQNAQNIDDFMDIIDEILADSSTRIEAIQIAGYTSPDGSEKNSVGLGRARAIAMREHIRSHHNLPDSIFEVADGGLNWNMVYNDIMAIDENGGSELVEEMKRESDIQRRESILKRYKGGRLYTELLERYFPAHRIACCTGVYYSNSADSAAIVLNRIIDELTNDPSPDYERILRELKEFDDDPRALNLQGIVEYRRHHRHAAEQAFAKAAVMGDRQALTNLRIIESNKATE